MVADADAEPARTLMATFKNGYRHEIPTITYGEYHSKMNIRAQSQNIWWKGTHCATKHKLELKTKLDRHELLILVEQQKQILQVRCNIWDTKKPDDQKKKDATKPDGEVVLATKEAQEKAKKLMITICKAFERDELKKGDLYDERDRMLVEEGILKTKRNGGGKKEVAKKMVAAKKDDADNSDSSADPDQVAGGNVSEADSEDHVDFNLLEKKKDQDLFDPTEIQTADAAKRKVAKEKKTPKAALPSVTKASPPLPSPVVKKVPKPAAAAAKKTAKEENITISFPSTMPTGIMFDPAALPNLSDEDSSNRPPCAPSDSD